ncbi:MAG TPA: DegT/DnrJ/EryC1/StrS family aminotransferase [bacterium]|nr:DegT/DnrJ/EryC1/StrS family aminotransferase [bacterium]
MSKRAGVRLAVQGGTPVRTEPLLPGYPGGLLIGEEEKAAVLEVLDSQSLFRHYGPRPLHKVAQFERAFALAMGARHAVGVSSGTAALMTALAALGAGPGDEVIVPTYTWVATINAVVSLGAVPVFVDIDDTLTLDPSKIDAAVTSSTKALLPVHMRGAGADMAPILDAARRHGLRVVEDAAQAVGGRYRGRRLGTLGDLGAYSLQYHKIITTGEGGMVVTDDTKLWERAVRYHDQGSARMEELDETIPVGNPLMIGINFRMGEITGAIGLVQLGRMDWIIDRMRAHKAAIIDGLAGTGGLTVRRIPDPDGDTGATLIFFLPSADTARQFSTALAAEGVRNMVAWDSGQHVYYHFDQIIERRMFAERHCAWECPHYKGTARLAKGMFPQTDDLLRRAIHIDLNPLLTERDEADIVRAVRKVATALL